MMVVDDEVPRPSRPAPPRAPRASASSRPPGTHQGTPGRQPRDEFTVLGGSATISATSSRQRHQSVLVEDATDVTTIVCCQASWSVLSFDAATLGDDGWDQAAGKRSLEKLHALKPDRVLFSHDWQEWTPPSPPG
jgi:hypothetical protein